MISALLEPSVPQDNTGSLFICDIGHAARRLTAIAADAFICFHSASITLTRFPAKATCCTSTLIDLQPERCWCNDLRNHGQASRPPAQDCQALRGRVHLSVDQHVAPPGGQCTGATVKSTSSRSSPSWARSSSTTTPMRAPRMHRFSPSRDRPRDATGKAS
jgi:hypothetical protein